MIYPNGTKVLDYGYDLAIIDLHTPIDWDRYGRKEVSEHLLINTICLPKLETIPFDDFPKKFKDATIFGFGWIAKDRLTDVLQRGNLKVKYDDLVNPKIFVSGTHRREARACPVMCCHS